MKGILAGIFGAAAFGFIPAFSKPVLGIGLSPACLLFYRFGVASVIIALILIAQGRSLVLPKKCIPSMILLAVFYCISGGFLVLGYKYMSGGVTGVLHFTYPVFVMVLLLLFFHERIKISSIIAILVAIGGIYCLGVLGGNVAFVPGANRALGVVIVVSSGLACASYMVGVNKTKSRELPSLLLTFWMLTFSTIIFAIVSLLMGELVVVSSTYLWGNFLGIAFIATVMANFLLVYSIKHVGSTLAAILGAVEPATAVILCIILFSESLNLAITIGIILIFVAVLIVVTRDKQ